jgi:NADPH:quinone reductase-like Zn-dependent oxidoreductase
VLALTRFGGQATHVVVPASQLLLVPDELSLDEAGALPVNYLTAYHLLFHLAPLKPGMKVLIHSAGGGVGLAAIQLARSVPGVELFGTASTRKHAFLHEYGLHHAIDPRKEDYVAEVRRLTGGAGVHRVLDPLGGPDWDKGYSLLRPAGHLLCFGWANMIAGQRRNLLTIASQFLRLKRFSPLGLMDTNRSVSGANMGHMWDEVELMRDHLEALLALARQGVVKPHVDAVYPLARAGEAHSHILGRLNVGKVLLDCD